MTKTKNSKKAQRISGRNKNSWRKLDNQDLEDFIDDKLLQQRLGTDFVSKPDHELFVVDTQPADERAEIQKSKKRLTKAERRSLLSKEKPACFQALYNTSKVSDPSGKRNHTKIKTLSRRTIDKKIKKGVFQRKLDDAKINRELHKQKVKVAKESCTVFKEDLWKDLNVCSKNEEEPVKEWLSKDSLICNKLNKKNKKLNRKKLNAPSVAIPHEGTSYNPTYKAHQDLLKNVVEDELKIIKDEKHLERVTSKMFRKVTPEELQKEHIEQLTQGLDDKQSDTENNETEYKPINPPVVNKKKTLKTRKHILEQKKIIAKAKESATEKRKVADIYKLRFIKNAVEKKETSIEKRKISRTLKKANTIKLPHISSNPFKEPSAIFQSSDELSGNLRNLKPQGGGLVEQFTSLQRRGIAPVSKPKTLKKAAKKSYTLSSHRMPWEQIERPVKSKKNAM